MKGFLENARSDEYRSRRPPRVRARTWAVVLAVACFVAACSESVVNSPEPRGQLDSDGEAPGMIMGRVVVDGTDAPRPGVNVFVEGTTFGSVTDLDGRYTIDGLPPGSHTVRASFVGYTNQVREDVLVPPDGARTVNFSLAEHVVGIDPIVITAGRP